MKVYIAIFCAILVHSAFAHVQVGSSFPGGLMIGDGDSNCSLCDQLSTQNLLTQIDFCNKHGIFNTETKVCDCFCDGTRGCFTSISFCTECDASRGWTDGPHCITDVGDPVISYVGDATVTHESGSPYVDAGATAWDNRDGDITGSIVADSTVVDDVPGTYTVTYSVTDFYGNSDSLVRTVVVEDTTLPTFDLVGDEVFTIEAGLGTYDVNADYEDAGITNIADNSVDVTPTSEVDDQVQTRTLGSYSVIWTVTDGHGNSASKTRTVVVIDTTPALPVIHGGNPHVQPRWNDFTDPGISCEDNSDNVPDPIVVSSDVDPDNIGDYTIVYKCVDINTGSEEFANRTVSITVALVGDSPPTAGYDCADIRANRSGESLPDGKYWINVQGDDPSTAIAVFCDMNTDGGGFTAITANGELEDEAVSLSCYPLISPNAQGCGETYNIYNDFILEGADQSNLFWNQMLAVSYDDVSYSNKLAYFGIQFSSLITTQETREGGSNWTPSGLSTTFGRMYCTSASYISSYTKKGTYNTGSTAAPAHDVGTVFGHVDGPLSGSSRYSFGFTDIAGNSDGQTIGIDDYQDGWSCGDAWTPQEVRGQRMMILVRRPVAQWMGDYGLTQEKAGIDCGDIAANNLKSRNNDGLYWIDPDNDGDTSNAVKVFCDMTSGGSAGFTAIVANGELEDEAVDPNNCYPHVSPAAIGCGNVSDLMTDFNMNGDLQGAIQWRYMLGVIYSSSGYSDKLAYFGVDFGTSVATPAERNNGNNYTPSSFSTTHGQFRCTSFSAITSYTTIGTYNSGAALASGRGTVLGHSTMSGTSRGSIGFTDVSNHSDGQTIGVDDYQDGWSCGDAFTPTAVRGERMVILVH